MPIPWPDFIIMSYDVRFFVTSPMISHLYFLISKFASRSHFTTPVHIYIFFSRVYDDFPTISISLVNFLIRFGGHTSKFNKLFIAVVDIMVDQVTGWPGFDTMNLETSLGNAITHLSGLWNYLMWESKASENKGLLSHQYIFGLSLTAHKFLVSSWTACISALRPKLSISGSRYIEGDFFHL